MAFNMCGMLCCWHWCAWNALMLHLVCVESLDVCMECLDAASGMCGIP